MSGKAYQKAGVKPGDQVIVLFNNQKTRTGTVVSGDYANKNTNGSLYGNEDKYVYVKYENDITFLIDGYHDYQLEIINKTLTETEEEFCPNCGGELHWVSLILKCKKCGKHVG